MPSPARQRRTVVLEVAMRTRLRSRRPRPARPTGVSLSSLARIRQPPSGARPEVAMSPPRLTRTPPSGAASRAAAAARSDAERLAARAEIELDARRDPDRSRPRVQADRLPAGAGPSVDTDGGVAAGEPAEVVVVSDDPHRPTDRRVDGAIGVERDGDRGRHRAPQERTDRSAPTRRRLEAHQLAVGAEAAVRPVDVVEHALDGSPCVARSPSSTNRWAFVPSARQAACSSTGQDEPVETCARPLALDTPLRSHRMTNQCRH